MDCQLAHSSFLSGSTELFALLIDKANRIDRSCTQIYCLTPSSYGFTMVESFFRFKIRDFAARSPVGPLGEAIFPLQTNWRSGGEILDFEAKQNFKPL